MDTKSMTYKELAEAWGCKLDSARKTVRRKGWQRIDGNDGQVRIIVPLDALPSPSDSPTDSAKDSPILVDVAVLEEKIEGLKALVESERRRADAAEADRDAWRALAERPLLRRLFG